MADVVKDKNAVRVFLKRHNGDVDKAIAACRERIARFEAYIEILSQRKDKE